MKDKKIQFLKVALFLGFFAFLIFGARVANAATLYFSPSSGNFSVGDILTMSILVDTQGQSINNSNAVINFPAGLLEVVSVGKSGSIFSLWVEEPAFSNSAGTISFDGGLPTPGFNGTAGKLLSVVFRVRNAGTASLIFSSGAVRANDGYGTDILQTRAQAQFSLISEERPAPPPTEEAPPVVSIPRPEIMSNTHPDEDKWYSNNDPLFKWDMPSGVSEAVLVLSRRANSPPTISYSPPISERLLDDLEEGEWYLNARFRTAAGLGPITSFKFNIDTQAPSSFTISRLDTDDLTNPRPRLLFESSDATSGLDRYEIKIGDGDWFKIEANEAGKAYALPVQRYGERLVEIKAFDKGGNSTSSNTGVIVKPIPAQKPIIKDVILPDIRDENIAIIKEEVEVVVKEVVVKEVVVKEVVVKGKIEKDVIIKEGAVTKVAAKVGDVFKLQNGNVLGQISESLKSDELDLIKTIEASVDENGDF